MNQDSNPRRPDDGRPENDAGSARETASRIWLAGLGALARAQAEGSKLFENLIKEGQGVQGRDRDRASEREPHREQEPGPEVAGSRFADAGKRLADIAAGLSQRTAESWDRFEGAFEERLAKGLSRLGVPSREELEDLQARVAELEDEVDRLQERRRGDTGDDLDTPAARRRFDDDDSEFNRG